MKNKKRGRENTHRERGEEAERRPAINEIETGNKACESGSKGQRRKRRERGVRIAEQESPHGEQGTRNAKHRGRGKGSGNEEKGAKNREQRTKTEGVEEGFELVQ